MIISKLILNQVVKVLNNTFNLEGIKDYVFKDNELDHKTNNLHDRVVILESLAHPKREFVVCDKCNKEIKEK